MGEVDIDTDHYAITQQLPHDPCGAVFCGHSCGLSKRVDKILTTRIARLRILKGGLQMRLMLMIAILHTSILNGQGNLSRVASHWKTLVASATIAAMISGTNTVPAQEVNNPWQRLNVARAKQHQRSSFYIVFDFAVGWRAMHVQYLGRDGDRGLLFVGSRIYIVDDGNELIINDAIETSLVGLNGLVEQGIGVEEHETLSNPSGRLYDLTVLKVKGVTLNGIEPVSIARDIPQPGDELEMLSYRADVAGNLIGFFGYPAMHRSCIAGLSFPNRWLDLNTCTVPLVPSSTGSPIFIKESGELYSFFVSIMGGDIRAKNADGQLVRMGRATIAPQSLNKFIGDKLPVDYQDDKMTTVWGKIKN